MLPHLDIYVYAVNVGIKVYCVSLSEILAPDTGSPTPTSLDLSRATMSGQVGQVKVTKSYEEEDPVKNYCLANSTSRHPVQHKLMQETIKLERVSQFLGFIF